MRQLFFFVITALILFSCKKEAAPVDAPPVTPSMYFPPIGSTGWEITTPASLNWNETELNNLYTYLQQKNTKAFIILKDGKIVAEKY
ncbi:MAG: serine hydrolase, partial [Chitinophagaceae bacterium]